MRFVMFYHSLVSDWNHAPAHVLRGVSSELLARGHEVDIYEPRDGWSRARLVAEHGQEPLLRFQADFPQLTSTTYDPTALDLDAVLADADAVLVHAWTDPQLIARIGQHRDRHGGYALLLHDSHRRGATDVVGEDLRHYDGILAAGAAIRQSRVTDGMGPVWTWHEAADPTIFHPHTSASGELGVVWIGNWRDGEQDPDLEEFFIGPVRRLRLRAAVHGVGWPAAARGALTAAGIEYHGWLANVQVPQVFADTRCTIHVPRRPQARDLPGVPSIRIFEALACGIPLVSAPWDDVDGLFRPGQDYLVARDGAEMDHHLTDLLGDPGYARAIAANGLERIQARHTCAHRVDELLAILADLGADEDNEEAVLVDENEEDSR